jgi:SNF2 family DNA or RNA helicase/ubiquinone/menaquinone biosynthesis C-methylase UbiE/biotin operon repressor
MSEKPVSELPLVDQEIVTVDMQIGEQALLAVALEEQADSAQQLLEDQIEPPEGWLSPNRLAQELSCGRQAVLNVLEPYREEQTGWFQHFKAPVNKSQIEYLHPEAVALARQVISESRPPEGWRTNKSLATELGVSHGTIGKFVKQLQADNLELEGITYLDSSGKPREHLSPQVVDIVRREYTDREQVPQGWMTNNALADELGVDISTTRRVAEPLLEEEPELVQLFLNDRGNVVKHYSPELVRRIRDELASRVKAPEGWMTKKQLAKSLGCAEDTVERIADEIPDMPEGWLRNYTVKSGHVAQHLSPELISHISDIVAGREDAPEGWMTISGIKKELGIMDKTAERMIEANIDEFESASGIYKDGNGTPRTHYSPAVVQRVREVLSKYEEAPEGWMTCTGLSNALDVSYDVIRRVANNLQEDHEDWVALYRGANRQASEHYSPELVEAVKTVIASDSYRNEITQRERAEQKKLIEDLTKTAEVFSDPETIEAQEFRSLISLFGSERIIDILYQYHPEYKKVPVPYVKSIIVDYLGDFLTVPGGLDLDGLEAGVQFLFDANLKDGLTEVVKQDCLRFYNQQKNAGLTSDDLDAILEHISKLRGETAHISTEELGEVFEMVEGYYISLFEDIQKPDCLVDELSQGRSFPDLNQRINIHEMATKQRMLIADEMGVGKSASAILTKEYSGIGLALIVAPSNVIDTWQNYLSDKVIDGEQVGYFKPGQAPRVLIVDGPESLEGINPADYDYIVMSQERLNDRYVEALQGVNYGMLVVDEVHKMKNLISGKRAENLVKLAEGIEDTDGAKYLALLSGTPIPNKVGDISTVLKLLYPEKFEGVSNKELTNQILYGDALDLRSLLVPRMQMKSLAESIKMPKLQEVIHHVDLTAEEREMYEVLLEEDEITASQKLQILRKFSLSPSILEATPDINGSKIQEVGAALRETFVDKDKVVMFVNGYIEGVIRGDSTIIEALGLPNDVEVFAIEGEVEKGTRAAIQQELQSGSRKMLVLVSGQTADVGVDFSGAQEVYFYNEPWTEYDKKQQLGRVYRPGLNDDLISRTFITRGTIEEGIHSYIGSKYKAVEKLLRGIPISDLEREMLKKSENQDDPNLEVNPELAEYYFSSWDRMMKIYGYVKELGEDDFVKFLAKYGREYADCYVDVGGRSYQANASRLSGTLIDRFVKERRKSPKDVRVLDIASGPEMLRKYISNEFSDRVISLDINKHHFVEAGQNRVVGSFLSLPFADDSVDYANLSLALHYTNFVPTKRQYERIEVLQEMNRVLSVGGRAVISLMHTLDLKDEPAFREAVTKLGFRVVEKYTGKTEDGSHFRTRLFTLEKTHDGPRDIKEAVSLLGPSLMKGFKFTKSKAKLRDSRKIATSFSIEGQQEIKTKFNEADQVTLEEERLTQSEMVKLQRKYGAVKDIPRDEVLAGGFSRIFNGKSYVLFRRLIAGSGSIVLR